ncbi:ribonuclease HII [Bacteroidota bacterium]
MKKFDVSHLTKKIKLLAGIDEAGRGPLAGPVVAAAVIFDKRIYIKDVNDSKKISENKRERLYDEIIEKCIDYSVGIISEHEIDCINILQSTLKAMKSAVDYLEVRPDLVLVDGNRLFHSNIPLKQVVKGDSKSFVIASASIIAKVTRDRLMRKISVEYPNYLWYKNKGYGTKEHIEAIKKFGITPIHRKSFLTKITNIQS